MKKIWICGGTGMLGSHFTRLLTKNEIPFVVSSSKEIDITHLDVVSDFVRVQKITHILNCAAYTNVDQAEIEEKKAYQINAMGAHHLGIAGRRHGAHVTHFSTDYVFDGKAHTPYIEAHSCSPLGAYGISKWLGEVKLLEEHARSCVIRTSWLFGFPGKNFVNTMLKLMSEQEEVKVVTDQIGRPTFCDDLAKTTLDLLGEEGIFHFANSSETSWYQFAEEIQRQANALNIPLKIKVLTPIPSKEYPTKAARPTYSTLSTRKVEEHLGRAPRSWHEALNDYLIQYKKLGKATTSV